MTSWPAASDAGVSSWLCVAASVRANGSIFASAAVSVLTSAVSVPRTCAAATVAGNSACSAAMSVVGSWTSHWVSWALEG